MTRLIITLLLTISASTLSASTPEPIDIYEGTSCGHKVRLTPYPAAGEGNAACIICPGGSYFWLDRDNEGHAVARRLQAAGISAFVLEYRVAGIPAFITHNRLIRRGNRYPDMLQDIQRSLQLVRANAAAYHSDPSRTGVIGFSAGGHLSLMSGIFFDTDLLSAIGAPPEGSLRPDFIAAVYPVVTLSGRYAHRRSARGLLGEGRALSDAMKDSLSLDRHVRPDMPPVYLTNCADDPVVHYRNSELLDSALSAAGVPHRYIQYPAGGHGFGAVPSKTTPETAAWIDDFINWINTLTQ